MTKISPIKKSINDLRDLAAKQNANETPEVHTDPTQQALFDNDQLSQIELINNKLSKSRHEVDKCIVALSNAYREYYNHMVELNNHLNIITNEK